MNLIRSLTKRAPEPEPRYIQTVDDYILAVASLGGKGVEQTLQTAGITVGAAFQDFARGGYGGNSVVFTCMDVRVKVFAQARLRWQNVRDGKPSDMFGSRELEIFERPWIGGTTQDLLSLMLVYADLAGNAFVIRDVDPTTGRPELVVLRPDWVEIAVEPRLINDGQSVGQVGFRTLGIVYYEGGKHSGADGVIFLRGEYAHFMPVPDPLAPWRGMSWLTPIVREIEADLTMTAHKRKFFENGATPNMIITHPRGANREKILAFQKRLEAEQSGTANAYRTLNLYPGADATVVGGDLSQIDFKNVQGAGETRIASAAGVPPVIAGLSEGMQGSSLNAGNYGSARRRFADGTMHPLWRNVAGSLDVLADPPIRQAGTILAHDARNVPFLREDEGDAAKIAQTRAATVKSLIDAGFTPESAVAAVEHDDLRLLVHTGLYSVQLRPAGSIEPPAITSGGSE